jgi:hypothetical protein
MISPWGCNLQKDRDYTMTAVFLMPKIAVSLKQMRTVSLKQIRDPFKITQSGDGTKTRTLVFG